MTARHLSGAICGTLFCALFILSTPFPALSEETHSEKVPIQTEDLPPAETLPATATPPGNESAATGITTTTPEVSLFTGSLTHTYPIVVPPGRNGIAPNLILTYSSQDDPGDSTRIFKWCLDKVEDTNGNYMTIAYTKDQGEIYPLQIDYTGNAKGLTPHRIVFVAEDRPDTPALSTTKFKVVTAKRLNAIEISSNNEPPASYSLAYAEATPHPENQGNQY